MESVNSFIMPNLSDQFIKAADELQLKLLIFIAQSKETSLDSIMGEFDIDKNKACEALCFLEKNKLIYVFLKDGQYRYSILQTVKIQGDTMPDYKNDVIQKNLTDNDYLRFLAYKAEGKLGRPLSTSEIKILFGAYDWLSLPIEVILMLVDYCCELDKKNLKYLEKIAVEWAKEGINSIEAAQLKLNQVKNSSGFLNKVKTILNLGDKELTLTEKKYISKWEEENISEKDIHDAYEKTIKNTGKCAIAYMNKIIMSNNKSQIEIKKVPLKKTSVNKKSRFDFEELERLDLEFLKKFDNEDI